LINKDFTLYSELTIRYVILAFLAIANAVCIYAWPDMVPVGTPLIYLSKLDNKFGIYPLTNDTGYFGYNSYLYALVNNVILLGIPYEPMDYDTIKKEDILGCPAKFLGHDMVHTRQMFAFGILTDEHLNDVREIRERILLSSYGRKDKECMIFYVWNSIHETYNLISSLKVPMPIRLKMRRANNAVFDNNYGVHCSKSMFRVITRDVFYSHIVDDIPASVTDGAIEPMLDMYDQLHSHLEGELFLIVTNIVYLLYGEWVLRSLLGTLV
jgi:hypothetical protein